LEVEQIDFIQDMVGRRVMGRNQSAVIRGLLTYAIQDIVKTGFIEQWLEARKARKG
jgi:hypothetical protein